MERIMEASEEVLEFLSGIPLSGVVLNNYQRGFHAIRDYCESKGIDGFSDGDAEDFIEDQRKAHERGEFGQNKYRQLRKVAVLMADHMQGRTLVWGRRNYKEKMVEGFEDILALFSAHLDKTLAFRTCQGSVSTARQLLLFLESSGTQDIKAMTADDVKQFLACRAQKYPNSMTHTVGRLKSFIAFLNSMGISQVNADRHLAKPAPRRVKLYPCFTDCEAAAIFEAVERSKPLGKRDYAILKTALGTGLRIVDILGLKRSDIDWEKNEISVLQSKTNAYDQLPLLTDVGNAIAEYILDARPASDSPYIFLRTRMPHKPLFATGADIINRYLNKAGITHEPWDGKSFHAFRRTAGTRLVRANVPLPTVAQMLTHRDIDSTKRYISLDDDTLRVCCLDISENATAKEGLR